MVSEDTEQKRKERIKIKRWIDDRIERGFYCETCGYDRLSRNIQKHHIAGRNNSEFTISTCLNCHGEFSYDQDAWNKIWTNKDNPPKVKLAFLLRGISKTLKMIANVLKDYSDKLLNGEI